MKKEAVNVDKIKVLFLIHDLGQGGAEKVLVNLVNNMDAEKFDITVMTLFDCGENRQFLSPHIRYRSFCGKMIRGNSHIMKLFTPQRLHKMIIKEKYDIEVAYLEGPCARVISGCQNPDTSLISWIHIVQGSGKKAAASFRSIEEAKKCYGRFDEIVAVSESVKKDFEENTGIQERVRVLMNTIDTDLIRGMSKEEVTDTSFEDEKVKLIGVGKLLDSKGFDKLIRITAMLAWDSYPVHLYIVGDGPKMDRLVRLSEKYGISDKVKFTGFVSNPYKYMARSDIFVCASSAEGFSTAASEAVVIGLPVCTFNAPGMKELFNGGESGIITENNETALYYGIRSLIDDEARMNYYRQKSNKLADVFDKKAAVTAVEDMLRESVKK